MSVTWHAHVCYKYSLGLRNSNLSYSNFIDRDKMAFTVVIYNSDCRFDIPHFP